MPARKNRPDKHGVPQIIRLRNYTVSAEENILAQKLIRHESKEPGKDHYVGWPDMDAAESMAKKGFLRKSGLATGCFYLTDLFKRQFQI